ncbi:MAG: 2-C-methyl-D-erythritol 4-phosphate cytidylyltransferase, partial [Alphaproteobacteria bacterium]|nr:2-C-methyl-D-erythritol 4-phosphate cytidylyltransferase [Alphaproteobacteria bacterium]
MRVALVLAAGRSLRLAAAVPKAYLPLAGEPVLRRSVRTFLDHPAIGAVRVVVHPDDAHLYAPALAGLPAGRLLAPIHGGGTRQDSARRGLESLRELWPQAVLIHDAARPFVGADLIDRVLAALAREEAVMPGLRVTDTPKRAAGTRVQATLDRADLWLAQTPQGFAFDRVLAAHRAAAGIELSDDAAVAERAGMAVAIVPGDPDNVKITTADDLARAERSTAAGLADVRVGQGFDVHRLAAGSGVTLCGVAVPCPHRL